VPVRQRPRQVPPPLDRPPPPLLPLKLPELGAVRKPVSERIGVLR
jgi:hypothetical protein